MYNLKARLSKLEEKHPSHLSEEQTAAFNEIISYLDSLAKRKACGDIGVQIEIETVNQFLKANKPPLAVSQKADPLKVDT